MRTHCHDGRPKKKGGGLFFGGALIIFGTAYLLDHLGMLGALRPWQAWPALPIWGGLLHFFGARHGGERVWGLLLMGFGAAFGAHYLGVLPFDWKLVWPILLIFGGLLFIAGGAFRRGCATPEMSTSGAGRIDIQTTFSGRNLRIDAQDFTGGRIRCRLGGCKVDLRRAEIENEEAIIDIDIVMGGAEIFVPPHWRVRDEISPIMGGVEDKTIQSDAITATKRLVLRGSAVMGGVEIKN